MVNVNGCCGCKGGSVIALNGFLPHVFELQVYLFSDDVMANVEEGRF